jgi:hypothetical protein
MKRCCFSLLLFLFTHYVSSNEIALRDKLREEVLYKPIFDYLVESEYQEKYRFIYDMYETNIGLKLEEAFKILLHSENELVYKNIHFVEEYIYYGIRIAIHRIPNKILDDYYLALADISGTALGFELLLFNSNGIFLDRYFFLSKYKNKKKIYEYKELFEGTYGIVILINTSSSGSYSEYLKFLVIDDDRFKEIFSFRFPIIPESIFLQE